MGQKPLFGDEGMVYTFTFGQTDATGNNPAYFFYRSVINDAPATGFTQDEARKGWLMLYKETDSPAVRFKEGFGNHCNNAVRNFASVNGELYLGTTSRCNPGDDFRLEYYG